MKQAGIRLKYKAILGGMVQGRAGLGSLTTTQYDSASGKERRKLLQDEVRASVEEERSSRTVAMRQQGTWLKWEQAMGCHLEGHLEVESPEDQVPDTGCLQHSSKPIQPVHMGQSGNTGMPSVLQGRDTGIHPKQLLSGTGRRPILL